MKNLFLSLFIITSLLGCQRLIKDKSVDTEEPVTDITSSDTLLNTIEITSNKHIVSQDDFIGYWVGMFEPNDGKEDKYILTGEHMAYNYANKILLSIDSISGRQVFGHSVVAGNNRPFKGLFTLVDDIYTFVVKEPGDDKYDGEFIFSINNNDTVIIGTWNAYKKIETSKRKYELTKKIFSYNPANELDRTFIDWNKTKKRKPEPEYEDYYDKEYFATTQKVYTLNASTQKLTKKDVENLTKADLFILRNAIYAKHGYSFKNRQLRAFFDNHDWYIPIHTDIKKDITPLEKENIQLLLKYEKNASEYYDEFGRG